MLLADAIAAIPPSGTAELLGQKLLAYDAASTRTRVAFAGRPEFLNPAGYIQGGFLTAMMDDTMGPSIWLATEGKAFPVTIDFSVSFLGAARVGQLVGEARVVQLGKTIAFLEAQLADGDGRLVARATASVRLVQSDGVTPRDA